MINSQEKIQIEVWSDIMCPFCYLGKKKFEKAMENFPESERVELIWKSYQLMPGMKTDPTVNINQFLAREKGFSVEQAEQMNLQMAEAGKPYDIDYNFNRVVVANSFKAHRFLHLAKDMGKQKEAQELVFKAYFTEGKNVDDNTVLLQIAGILALDTTRVKAVLDGEDFSKDVLDDISEANQLGIRGVPCFVIDRKYAISGAQEPELFLSELTRIAAEYN